MLQWYIINVLHLGGGLGAVQLIYALNPLLDGGRILVGVLDGSHDGSAVLLLLAHGAKLKLQHRGVGLDQSGLIEHLQPQPVVLSVWPRHLQSRTSHQPATGLSPAENTYLHEPVHVSDGGDVLRNEALQRCLKFHLRSLVSLDVLEEVTNLHSKQMHDELTGMDK